MTARTCSRCKHFPVTGGDFRPCLARPCMLTQGDRLREMCDEFERKDLEK